MLCNQQSNYDLSYTDDVEGCAGKARFRQQVKLAAVLQHGMFTHLYTFSAATKQLLESEPHNCHSPFSKGCWQYKTKIALHDQQTHKCSLHSDASEVVKMHAWDLASLMLKNAHAK